jgi:hypothetical protein
LAAKDDCFNIKHMLLRGSVDASHNGVPPDKKNNAGLVEVETNTATSNSARLEQITSPKSAVS